MYTLLNIGESPVYIFRYQLSQVEEIDDFCLFLRFLVLSLPLLQADLFYVMERNAYFLSQ